MNPSDAMTIQAFTAILPELDTILSQDLKQAVHRVGQHISTHQPETAADQIRDLVQHHECLKEPFTKAYDRLREQYQSQERSKTIEVAVTPTGEVTLDALTLPILTADNFLVAAKTVLKQMGQRVSQTSEEVQAYVSSLQLSVARADEQAIVLLRALDQRFHTPKELAQSADLPLEQVQATLQTLWQQGYIEPVTGSALYKVFPRLRTQHSNQTIDAHTYFTLTSRGHFFLHPVVSFNRQSRSFL